MRAVQVSLRALGARCRVGTVCDKQIGRAVLYPKSKAPAHNL